jgi:hypothetical protein
MESHNVPILRCDQPTPTGYFYPREVIEKAIKQVKQPLLGIVLARGEQIPTDKVGKMNLGRISHEIVNLRIDDDGMVRGDARILNTPDGFKLRESMRGGPVAFRPCSKVYGDYDKDKKAFLVHSCSFITIDVVPGAENK